MTRIAKYLFILTLIIAGFSSNMGLNVLLETTAWFIPLEFEGLHGSLYTNQIYLDKFTLNPETDEQITLHGIAAHHINLLHRQIDHLAIKNIEMPLSYFQNSLSGQSSFFSIKGIHIESLLLKAHKLLNPISLHKIDIEQNHNVDIFFEYDKTPINLSLNPQPEKNHYQVEIATQEDSIVLTGIIADTLSLTSDDKHHAISLNYDANGFRYSIDSHSKKHALLSDGYINGDHILINLEKLYYNSPFLYLNGKGVIDSEMSIYAIDIEVNDSNLRTQKTDGKLIVSGHLDELSHITPYAEGDCEFNFEYENGSNFNLYTYSKTLILPFARITDAQLSYDPQNKRYLNFSASQLRNPIVLLSLPSFSLQKIEGGHKIDLVSFYHDTPEQISARVLEKNNNLEFIIDKFIVQNRVGDFWTLDRQAPIIITSNEVVSNPIEISYQDQKISLDAHYNRQTQAWKLDHAFKNTQLSLSSQGLIDADTEVNISKGLLNGKATASYAPKKGLSISGFYDFSSVSASLLNILPNFVFPLDYEILDSHIRWEDGNISAELYSPQGKISIYHDQDTHYINVPDIAFNHHKNYFNTSADFSYSNNVLGGNLLIKKAFFILDPDNSFEVFPKDIDIIGEIITPKSSGSNITMNINVSAHKAPVNLFGFQGTGECKLNVHALPNKPMLASGFFQIHDPSLTLLNRSIKLQSFSIEYNNQPWLRGDLNLSLEQNITIGSGNANLATTDIKLLAFGPLNSPGFNVSSSPISISTFEAFSHIFAKSEQLPPGNENYPLLEAISGLKRNQGIVILLQAIGSMSKFLQLDIALKPSYNEKQTFSDDFAKADLTLSKEISKKVWFIMRRQINEDNSSYAFNYKINPWLSSELQFNKDDMAVSLFYRN